MCYTGIRRAFHSNQEHEEDVLDQGTASVIEEQRLRVVKVERS
jgi:hypothetical protein